MKRQATNDNESNRKKNKYNTDDEELHEYANDITKYYNDISNNLLCEEFEKNKHSMSTKDL